MASVVVWPTGGQQRFSDLAIETALTLRLVFHVPLRQTEGFVRSIVTVMRAGRKIGEDLRCTSAVIGGPSSCPRTRFG